MSTENVSKEQKGNDVNRVLAPVVCYLCQHEFKEGEIQLDMYGEIVCQSCWDYEMEQMMNMQ